MITQNSNVQGGHTRGRQSSGADAKARSRLSDASLLLLGAGAGRADRLLLPPPASCRARGKALERVLGSLLKAGLVREVPVMTDEQAWRKDEADEGVGLAITDAGRHAIGVPAAQSQSTVPAEEPARKTRAAGKPKVEAGDRGTAVGPPVSEVHEAANTGASPVEPEQQRQTKQARLVSLLFEPGGQSVDSLGNALGWLPHTVRASLTGLRQKGFALTRGKNEAGTTVYRVEGGAAVAGSAAKAT